MKFYVCHDVDDQAFDCCFTLKKAKEIVNNDGGGAVVMVDVPVNADTIQRLLGNRGNYATKIIITEVN
jgi:hypothetical protein